VVANGRLYVRDYDALTCYDVRDPDRPRKKVPDAVFVPTPEDVVDRMLDLAGVKKTDVVYDLGSGDGRVLIAAARRFGCRAVGVELDADLVAASRAAAKKAGVGELVRVEHGDLFEADFSGATVVALYILPGMSRKLVPELDELKPGSRAVIHCFAIPGVKPDKVVRVTSAEDDVERPVYLYTVPLAREKPAGR
jgi:SAM-dependent methyltransferase